MVGPLGIRRYIHSATASVYSATVATQALGLIVAITTARLLTTSEFGLLTKATVWSALIGPLLTLGLPDASLILASRSPDQRSRSFSTALVISLGLASLGSAILCALLVAGSLPLGASVAAALSLPVFAASGVVLSLEQHLEAFGQYSRLLILTNVITVALIAVVGLAGLASVSTMLVARLCGNVPIVVWQLIRRRSYVFTRQSRSEFMDVSRNLVREGAGFHVSGVLALLATRLDQLFAVRYLNSTDLGSYGVALTIAAGIRPAGNAVSTVGVTRVAHATSTEVRRALFRRHVGFGLGTVGIVGLGVAALSYFTIPLLYGDRYGGARVAAVLLSAGVSLAVSTELMIRIMRGLRLVRPGIVGRCAGLVTTALLAPVLIDGFGLYGAATVSIASGGIMMLTVLVLMFGNLRRGKSGG